uniref:Ion transport domain-containing protein n=1 Tax=Phytophthora ramorum TaxID=164328 RepID=H3HCU5_PHYRM
NEKLAWDAVIMLVVLYSAIIVPVQVGFPEIQLGAVARTIAIISDVLFFVDVVHNFLVGYYPDDDENIVRDRRLIAKRYLASWFLPDLRHFVAKVEDALDLDAVLARLTRLIGQVLLVTHIFSCFWHLIGFTTEDEGHTWMIDADVRYKSVSERYVYSFYWVVATRIGTVKLQPVPENSV